VPSATRTCAPCSLPRQVGPAFLDGKGLLTVRTAVGGICAGGMSRGQRAPPADLVNCASWIGLPGAGQRSGGSFGSPRLDVRRASWQEPDQSQCRLGQRRRAAILRRLQQEPKAASATTRATSPPSLPDGAPFLLRHVLLARPAKAAAVTAGAGQRC
jgi:hypothetical protein